MGWESFFWAAFERSRNAMLLVDDHRRHVRVNDAAVEILGYPREQLLAMAIDDLLPPGERPRLAVRWELMVGRGEPLLGERDLVRPDGSVIELEWAAHPEVVTGRLLVLFVILAAHAPTHSDEADAREGEPLTPREREIVQLLTLGMSGPEIAEELFVSHETVRTHVRNAMEKTGARTRAQLVAQALGQGVIAVA